MSDRGNPLGRSKRRIGIPMIAVTVIGISTAVTTAPGCSNQASSQTQLQGVVRFSIDPYHRAPGGEYIRPHGIGGLIEAVPSELKPVAYLPEKFDLKIRPTDVGRRTATFEVERRGEKRTVEAGVEGGVVYFDEKRFKIQVNFECSTLAHYPEDAPEFDLPVTVGKIQTEAGESIGPIEYRVGSYEVHSSQAVSDSTKHRLRQILSDAETFGLDGASCFSPGMAIRIKDGDKFSDILVCLDCGWIWILEKDKNRFYKYGMSAKGERELTEVYEKLFGPIARSD